MKKLILFLIVFLLFIPFVSLSYNISTDKIIVMDQTIDHNELSNSFIDISITDKRSKEMINNIHLTENFNYMTVVSFPAAAENNKITQGKTGEKTGFKIRHS